METPGHVWRFATCEFDDRRYELHVSGTLVDIEVKPLEVLRQLLLHAGEVVTKEELLESVWPGLMVVDGSLATAVSKVRKALGRDGGVIVTVPRAGYRLAVPVQRRTVTPPAWPELQLDPGAPVPGRDQWRLARRLDLSPSSEVWLAEHPKTHETRVFKFAPDAERLRGLKREVTLARLLRESLGERPEFVRILEWNFTTHPYFVESEYVGPNLTEWAEQHGGLNRIPLDVRLRLLVDVAQAVADAHALDVLHKDLKPGNILVANGPQVKVADFGSAALLAPERLGALGITNLGFTRTTATGTTSLTGTMLYMAPEVLAGQSPTAASDVYALGVLLYQLIVGDFRKPLAPGWEADVIDPLLREDIASAADGDPARRKHTAAELADRLRTLERRRAEREQVGREQQRAEVAEQARAAARVRRRWLAVVGATVLAAIALTAGFYRWQSSTPAPVKTLAVLPFVNLASDSSLDFLRIALPDEVATALSHTRRLAVRPFASTSSYAPTIDVSKAARELSADGIVTGRFVKVGPQLHITLEGIDVNTARAVWRDTIDAPADSLIAVQLQIALRVRAGLAPAFGGSAVDMGAQPRNEEAYQLFLRSVSLALEPGPNPDGIAMLEKAVALDPTYAPAWVALARRYYVGARYVGGPENSMERYEAAMERAVSLDADYSAAAAGLIVSRVERGDILGASQRAEDLVRRRPDSADAHFALSYALRFAGLLDEAGDHCEAALLLDPHSVTSGLRSCAIVFFLRGDYPRAMNYQQLYLGSDWAKAFSLDILVREGRRREAAEIGAPHIPQYPSYDMLAACVDSRPVSEILALARMVRPSDDPESNYLSAAHLAYCGQTAPALEMLGRAIEGHYCSYPSLDSDPLFSSIRTSPKIAELRAGAVECQRAFLAARGRAG